MLLEMPFTEPTPDEVELRTRVRRFLRDERRENPEIFSSSGYDRQFSERLGARGWLCISIPTEYGGGGRDPVEQFIVAEELRAVNAPTGAHHVAARQTAPMLLRFGSEDQKKQFLPGIAAGTIGFALGLSETEAGSDLSALRTRAEPVSGGFLLSGTKIWTSWGHLVPFAVVLCRTSAETDRHHGLTQLIVDLGSPGVKRNPIKTLDGQAHFCEMVFENVFVPRESALGEVGNGWKQIGTELAYERSGPDRWLSTFRIYEALVEAAGSSGHPGAAVVGHCAAWYRTLHELSYGIARSAAAGLDVTVQAAIVKDLGTKFEQQVVELARHLLGAGLEPEAESRLTKQIGDMVLVAPGYTIRGGTNEILRTIISRSMLR
jgi:alkylation response protein AidB-like acyl-CoA dehydrogenase